MDDGARILPAVNYMEYRKTISDLKGLFEEAVRDFLGKYEELKTKAKVDLNGMYNERDYPPVAELARRYNADVVVLPLPDASDFRVDMEAAEHKRVQDDMEKNIQSAIGTALKDIWDRMFRMVNHLAERLGDKDSKFRDSLLTNIIELCDMLPRLNITGDPAINQMIEDVRKNLCEYDPDTLRKDEKSRKEAHSRAVKILEGMKGYISKEEVATVPEAVVPKKSTPKKKTEPKKTNGDKAVKKVAAGLKKANGVAK
jgi:hypothetical protein